MSETSETSSDESITSKYKDVLPTITVMLSSDTSDNVDVVCLSSDDEEDYPVQSENPTKKSATEAFCIEDDVKKFDAMKNKIPDDDVKNSNPAHPSGQVRDAENSGHPKHDAPREIIWLCDDLPSSQSSNSVSNSSG